MRLVKIRYWLEVLTIIPLNLFGLVWYYAVYPFRAYARHTVHLYLLQQKKPMQRLAENHPVKLEDRYEWQSSRHKETDGGYILNDRTISLVEYIAVKYILWGWVDDDSYEDTYSQGHLDAHYKTGESKFLELIDISACKCLTKPNNKIVGNAFDLGDRRALEPLTNIVGQMIWNTRNMAYNFEYSRGTIVLEDDEVFLVRLLGMSFGYKFYKTIDGKNWYDRIIMKNF